jgi:hypothetical protein
MMSIIDRFTETDVPENQKIDGKDNKQDALTEKVETDVAADSNNEVKDIDQSIETTGTTVTESPNTDSIGQKETPEYIKSDTFEELLAINPDVYEAIKKNMEDFGFDKNHPIILGTGDWTPKPVVVDGHTRLKAAIDSGVEPIFVIKTFLTEDDAFFYVVHEHTNRRNLSNAEKTRMVTAADKRLKKGGDTRAIATSVANGKPVRSSAITSEKTGIPRGTVEKIRKITAEGTPLEIKEAVNNGEMSINKGYNQALKANRIAKARKQKPLKDSLTPPVITQLPVSTAPTVAIQSDNNDVAAEKGPSIQARRDMITKSESLNPEYNADKILEAGVYFRKFDTTWGPGINLAEALPASDLDKVVTRFNNLVARIKAESDKAAKCAAEVADKNQTLPGIDSKAPITDDAKGNKDTSQNVSRLVTWVEPPRNQDKTNGHEINN